MNQREAVIRILEENKGIATLGHIYQNIFKITDCKWQTKTPDATIRRIVQDQKYFFKIRPGLWALNSFKNQIPDELIGKNDTHDTKTEEYNHSYYQGLLVELGNMKNYSTFIPNQDKNKLYVSNKLGEIATFKTIPQFCYDQILIKAKTVDVIWFNDRNMPDSFFEVEHSTNIEHSLLKFIELQDFNSKFFIVADGSKERLYNKIIESYTFKLIKTRLNFYKYQRLASYHELTSKLLYIENN